MTIVQDYFKAFAEKNTKILTGILADDVSLQEPGGDVYRGKQKVLSVMNDIFQKYDIDLTVKHFCSDNADAHTVEFSIQLTDRNARTNLHIDGVDAIQTKAGKISSIRAYLDVRK